MCIRDSRYVSTPAKDGRRTEELFDASGDPLELTSVANENPELLLRLRDAVRLHVEEGPPAPWGTEAPTLDVDEINLHQLRALGYALPGA